MPADRSAEISAILMAADCASRLRVKAGFFIGGVLCSIPSAILTDRLGRVWALRLGAIICTIGGILTTAATGAPMFLVGRIVLGMGQAFNICGGPILVNGQSLFALSSYEQETANA